MADCYNALCKGRPTLLWPQNMNGLIKGISCIVLPNLQLSTPYFISCMKSTACPEAITSSLTFVFSIPRRWNLSGQYLLERSLVCNHLKSKKLAVLSVCMVKVYLQKDFEYLILMLHHNRFQVYSRFNTYAIPFL